MSETTSSNPDITIRPLVAEDKDAVTAFAQAMPGHDLLFLSRDIRNDKVVSAWLKALEQGTISSLIAVADGKVVATTAIVRDRHGWSPHVADLRVIVSPDWRGHGLGRLLVEQSIASAIEQGAAKIIAQMTPDQRGAITMFEENGFRPEALLRDHVRDADGALHDLVYMSLNVSRAEAISEAYR